MRLPYLFCLIILLFFFSACQNGEKENKEVMNSPNQTSNYQLEYISPSQSNVDFNNELTENQSQNRLNYEYYYNGGGVAIGDINNDQLADIVFTGNMKGNRLYINKGDFEFEDISTSSGIAAKGGWNTGVNMIDINNDGWLDIYICRSGPSTVAAEKENLLFINQKDNTFLEAAKDFGLNDNRQSVQSTFFDYDKDGDLDMYLLNHPAAGFKTKGFLEHVNNIAAGNLQLDRFYERVGDLYVEKTAAAGFKNFGYRHGVSVSDFDQNGFPDLYLSSDFDEPDLLYFNNGKKQFENNIDNAFKHISNFSMGSDAADINNDGLIDLFVVDMTPEDHRRSKENMATMNPNKFYAREKYGFHKQYMVNTLQLNNGNGHFSEIGQLAGISKTDWSWAPLLIDIDNDGFQDLFVTNGVKRDVLNNDTRSVIQEKISNSEGNLAIEEILNTFPSTKIANYVFKNNKDLTFSKQNSKWINGPTVNSNGAAYGDLDNDGDLDLVINNVDDIAGIYKNNSQNNFIKIKLRGSENNIFAIGSKVELNLDKTQIVRENYPVRGYLSAVENDLTIGIGTETKINKLTVSWPDGKKSILKNPGINKTHLIDYSKVEKALDKNVQTNTLFTKITDQNSGINFVHKENSYNDFEREILLPHKQSQHGPSLAKADVNNDGLIDFYIGGAAGQTASLFIQKNNGSFSGLASAVFEKDKNHEDVAALFFDIDGDSDQDLYVSSGGNEMPENSIYYQDRVYINDGKGNFSKSSKHANIRTSGGSVHSNDIDKDGDLDLFVAGRQSPGKYPLATDSYILINESGQLIDQTEKIAPALKNIGMLTDAVFSDYDSDGDDDLFVVGEWMPLRILENNDGHFQHKNIDAFDESTGLWFSIAANDIDQDGDQDYFVGNLGLNSKFKTSGKKSFHIYANDFDDNGSQDIVLSSTYNGQLVPVRGKECSSEQMPFIKDKFPSYKAFANASLEDILGEEKINNSVHYKANLLHSVFIENKGNGGFVIHELPKAAQMGPIMDWLFMDLNNDNKQEVLFVGSMHETEVETVSYDALQGAILSWESQGKFNVIPSNKTNFYTSGDAKKMISFPDSKGKSNILVANNNGAVDFFRIK